MPIIGGIDETLKSCKVISVEGYVELNGDQLCEISESDSSFELSIGDIIRVGEFARLTIKIFNSSKSATYVYTIVGEDIDEFFGENPPSEKNVCIDNGAIEIWLSDGTPSQYISVPRNDEGLPLSWPRSGGAAPIEKYQIQSPKRGRTSG